MGLAVIFRDGQRERGDLAAAPLFLLAPLHLEYLRTIAFILVIAALVQFEEMYIRKKLQGALHRAPAST